MKQLISVVFGVSMLSSVMLAEGMQTQEMPTTELIKQNRQIVKLASEEISKSLPQKVDNYTTMTKVEAKENTMVYIFEINTGAKSDETVKKEDHSRMEKAITKGICKTQQRFLDAEINISYLYKSATSKAVLFQFDVNKNDCGIDNSH
jgi:hypothetical protein